MRYAVFAFPTQYPAGGWHDYHSSHASLAEAIAAAKAAMGKYNTQNDRLAYWHIVDFALRAIVRHDWQD